MPQQVRVVVDHRVLATSAYIHISYFLFFLIISLKKYKYNNYKYKADVSPRVVLDVYVNILGGSWRLGKKGN